MAEMEKRKMRGICRHCGEPRHKSSECDKPRVFKGTHLKRGAENHCTSECRKLICTKCKGEGHTLDQCTGPEKRSCRICNEVGHLQPDYKAPVHRRVRYPPPHDAAESKATADVEEPEPAPPTLPESWTNLIVNNSDADPKDLANYLEQVDIVGDLDNYALREDDADVEDLIDETARRTAGGENGQDDWEDESEEEKEFEENARVEQ